MSNERVTFLDNLRWLFVLFVIIEHSSNAYTGLIWWPVNEQETSLIAGWISAFSDAVAMPLLFFISGYFAIPSIENKGGLAFIKGKLKRIGIPWLLCTLTVCPVLPLVYHFTRHDLSLVTSYGQLCAAIFKNAARFDVGLIVSMDDLMANNQFYQRYMWFLSLLFLFFLIFGLVYMLKKSWFHKATPGELPPNQTIFSTLKFLFGIGFLTTICSFLTIGAMFAFGPESSNPEPLFTLGNLIQFRPSRLPFFIVYFTLGIMSYKNQWIRQGCFPGQFKIWAASWVSLLVIYMVLHFYLHHGPEDLEEILGMIFFLVLNFLTMATLGAFASTAIRYWNRPTAFSKKMASSSYNMYLSHYIFVIVFQLMFYLFPGLPGLMKFSLVSVLSVTSAYMVSHYVITPFPRVTVFAMGTLFMAMVLFIAP